MISLNNYVKYRLKPQSELLPLFANDTAILVCGKCFKAFSHTAEEECAVLTSLAEKSGKTPFKCTQADFLCSAERTKKILPTLLPEGTKKLLVAACGLGIQTVASLTDIPVFAAADSIGEEGHHGMTLSELKCGGCGECYLNLTGGICPVVDCAKSLLNGQCGGAKNGKCEVYPQKDCAWEKIEAHLTKQGTLDQFRSVSVQIRDYSKTSLQSIRAHVSAIRENKSEFGGVHPPARKERSQHLSLVDFPAPAQVVIPLSQHIGAPALPLVQAGDYVYMGQKIGEAQGAVSANIHASVSGTVAAVENRPHPTLGSALSVIIDSDGKDAPDPSLQPHSDPLRLSACEIIDIIREKGIVGMGGAAFPTAVKLSTDKKVDTVLLNGCECESLLTADHQLILSYADDVVLGLKLLMKATGAENGMIAVEDNKSDAADLLREKIGTDPSLKVTLLKTRYPQGAEKVLIRTALGRTVPSGGLPADVGVLVCNVSTSKAAADALSKGLPPIARALTVSGEKISSPANFMVRIGTPAIALLTHCGLLDGAAIKFGGAMMGTTITDWNVPVMKATGGIIAVETLPKESSECIRCGRCVDVCPMELSPLYFANFSMEGNWAAVKEKNITDCIECGCCQYICPSAIPLVEWIKGGKRAVREMK